MLLAWRVGALLLALYLATYGGGPHAVDEIAELGVARSLAARGAFDVDELYWTAPAAGNRADAQVAVGPSGEVWSKKGPLPSLLMLPWVALAGSRPGLDAAFAALLAMVPVTAATAALLVVLARSLGLSARPAAAAGLIYGLATPAWAYSRLGFGEPAIALAVVAAALAARGGTVGGAALAGLFVALGGWSKPSALALALPVAAYVVARAGAGPATPAVAAEPTPAVAGAATDAVTGAATEARAGSAASSHGVGAGRRSGVAVGAGRRSGVAVGAAPARGRPGRATTARAAGAAAFGLGVAAGLVPLGWYNLVRFGSPFATGYALGAGEDFSGSLPLGLAGLLLSPYRGLLWFAPICLVALALAPLAARRAPAEVGLAVGAFVVTLLTYAAWWTWWGGYAWGPRFLLPGLALLAPIVPLAWGALGRAARASVVGVAALSAALQLPGVLVDFNPFERALRASWPDFPREGPLFDPATAPVVGHVARLWREGAGALDLAWAHGGRPDWTLALALGGAVALAGAAAILALRPAGPVAAGDEVAKRSGGRRPALPAVGLDAVAALALALAVGALLTRGPSAPSGAAADLLRLAERRAAAAAPGDGTVVLASPEVPALWAHDRAGGPTYGLNRDDVPADRDAERLLRLAAMRHQRIWLLASNVAAEDPLNGVERWLARETFAYDAVAVGGARLRLFLTAGEPPPVGPLPLARLGDGRIELAAARVRVDPPRVELVWRGDGADVRGLAVFVHLYGDAGPPVGQVDVPLAAALPEGSDPARFVGEAVGRYAPRLGEGGDGRLTVGVGLYRPADGARLPARGADGARLADDVVRLGTLGAR